MSSNVVKISIQNVRPNLSVCDGKNTVTRIGDKLMDLNDAVYLFISFY